MPNLPQMTKENIENFLDLAVEEYCIAADVNDFSMDDIMAFYIRKTK